MHILSKNPEAGFQNPTWGLGFRGLGYLNLPEAACLVTSRQSLAKLGLYNYIETPR